MAPGSIPACAREPMTRFLESPWTPVYPRVCGGTTFSLGPSTADDGLSPRVRGNLNCQGRGHPVAGSIPACAGEPQLSRPWPPRSWVYPRVCGGTSTSHTWATCSMGLSPRVRGNLRRSQRIAPRPRSIPACAGEPCIVLLRSRLQPVYPRVCGGTCLCELLS